MDCALSEPRGHLGSGSYRKVLGIFKRVVDGLVGVRFCWRRSFTVCLLIVPPRAWLTLRLPRAPLSDMQKGVDMKSINCALVFIVLVCGCSMPRYSQRTSTTPQTYLQIFDEGKQKIFNMPQEDGTSNIIVQRFLGDSTVAQFTSLKGVYLGTGGTRAINGSPFDIFVGNGHFTRGVFGSNTQLTPVSDDLSQSKIKADTSGTIPSTITFLAGPNGNISNVKINGWLRYTDPDSSNLAFVTNSTLLPFGYQDDSTVIVSTAAYQTSKEFANQTRTVLVLKNSTHRIEIKDNCPVLGCGSVIFEDTASGKIRSYRINAKLEREEILEK